MNHPSAAGAGRLPPGDLAVLRARLEEAEATISAIRSGSVDALLVGGPGSEQVYTLSGADRSMRELAEHMSDGAAILTADGTVVWANRRLAEILGQLPRRLLGRSLVDLVDGAVRGPIADLISAPQRGNRAIELVALRPDGSEVPIRIGVIQVSVGGQPGRAIVATDLTQQRATEEILRRSATELEELVQERTRDLEQTTRDLEAFTYSASHDLRAPLRAITAFSQILLEEHADALDPEGRRVLGVVLVNTRRMGALIDDLLALSRVGHMELELRPVDMRRLAHEAANEARGAESGRQIDVEIGRLCEVMGEPSLLRQVWTNLIGNAVKFTRNTAAARVEVRCERADGECRYTVSDNGVGFEPEYAGQLFQPFNRLHPASEFEGTGIGLAIVERIVGRHGGRVWADGRPGAGATIGFALPWKPASDS